MKLALVKDEIGTGVEVNGTALLNQGTTDLKNLILTELSERKHELSPADWHDLCVILTRVGDWIEGPAAYGESTYREEFIKG